MSTFKCKMCGGTIEFDLGATVGVCDSCGTRQTLPRLDDDKKANLYDRANHFRRNNDFDKAMGIYEQILNEDKTDAESYWSLVLCRYGIEYVEDPAMHRRVPTVNRAQFTSIFADEDYKSAIQYADSYQKSIYEEEAKAIDEIQKGILAISQKEEPFDVFICYKDTDANGRRTQDSVLANELYHELTNEGFKVFFSRITLEDKLGTAYEPYIFAALNSAKVMVVLGTKPEYFNAVWVKNEWSRYLALIKNGAKKMLIPAYRDMDPYDLPEEFSHLQAQDMSKLGFMQDLIRGIKKIIGSEMSKPAVKETAVVQQTAPAANSNVEALLERGYMALEDGEWQRADGFFEEVLNQDAKNANAYLGKLMTELKVGRRENLKDCAQPFDGSNNYQKVLRFGDAALVSELKGDIAYINDRNENARLTALYNKAVQAMQSADTEESFVVAARQFEVITSFSDADAKAEECREQAKKCREESEHARLLAIYNSAVDTMRSADTEQAYRSAASAFQLIPSIKDAAALAAQCLENAERRAEEQRIVKKRAAKKKKKIAIITATVATVAAIIALVTVKVIIPNSKYNAAVALINDGQYVDAYKALTALNGYKDSTEKANEIFEQYKVEKLKVADIGDIVYFGAYEQDNDSANGKEDVEWLVLDKEGGKILVISKYALDCQQYNYSHEDLTWEICSLRSWLNNTFLNNTFTADEQENIETQYVSADKNPKYTKHTDAGNSTYDKLFLLSITEAENYFPLDSARQCFATAYAKAQGVTTNANGNNCWWWLRSLGLFQDEIAYVNRGGAIEYTGRIAHGDYVGVRPAMWINIDN